MKERIFTHWKTTIIGLILLAVGIFLLVTGKATLTEFCVLLPVVLGLMYIKDPSKIKDDEAPPEKKPDNT